MKAKLSLAATILVALLLASACGTGGATTAAPPGSQPPAAPADTQAPPTAPPPTPSPTVPPKPEPTRVEFQAEDGHALVGYYYPSPYPNAPVVVLMHMMGFTQAEWVSLGMVDWLQNWPSGGGGGMFAPALQTSLYPPMSQGISFAVFTFDYRGMGESVPPELPNSMTSSEFDQWIAGWLMDSKAAYEKAKNLPGVDPARIAGIGASIGADGVVDACGEGCLGALSLSPGNYLNVKYTDAVKAVDDAGKPVWCIAHEKDKPSADACKAASGEHYKSILYTEGGGQYGTHGMMFLMADNAPPDIGQVIQDWLFLTFNITP
ncbi:MAG: hypothetical protein Q7T47_05610 [Anaerolineales bacterium]|nr:hypothetical protein [Anaerolineales bacterium]